MNRDGQYRDTFFISIPQRVFQNYTGVVVLEPKILFTIHTGTAVPVQLLKVLAYNL